VTDTAADAVLQIIELGTPPSPWPTVDPFLFCVHHHDAYPEANEFMGPAASLEARDIGMDFAGKEGWNMYHGAVVPGFPAHPHRGFETVTYVRRGVIDHSDSLGATARFGRGDVQWLTAGKGIVHSEMFPLLDERSPNPLELFQIWVNLPRADKMVDPYFTMLWDDDVPTQTYTDASGRATTLTVIAGPHEGLVPPAPPPDSWASRPDADFAIWHLVFEPGASWTLPPAASEETIRTLYLFEGGDLTVGDTVVPHNRGAVVAPNAPIELTAATDAVEVLVLQGRPIGEPVAQYGPFVMNDKACLEQTFRDYQATGFGGWPFAKDDPVHAREQGRFAIHADGHREDVA
jgi:redox-sensitive bicupin YhaK (pirin superfamily)